MCASHDTQIRRAYPVGINPSILLMMVEEPHGNIDRYKGRLVVRGFSQKSGIDYSETFFPVVRLDSIRLLLAFAVKKGMKVHQMDVVTAFLNGHLDEEIYMNQPEGFIQSGKDHLVCKLKRSLYGLKQAPRCWNRELTDFLISSSFIQSMADPCVFFKSNEDNSITVLAVYVDDIILLTNTDEEMAKLKHSLSVRFKMKDLGSLHYILGIHVEQREHTIRLHQKYFIKSLLNKFGMGDCKPVSTPITELLGKNDGFSKSVDPKEYQSMVGSLLYLAIATRPDISFAVGVASKFNSCPNESHLAAVKRIMRYLKETLDLGILYSASEELHCVGYSDADWANDIDNRHSTTGNIFIMNGGPICWLSQKQSIVAQSTAEAEYVALWSAAKQAVWLCRLLNELGLYIDEPLTIFEDNQAAIAMSKNPVNFKRSKHIDVKYHFVRQCVEKAEVQIIYCPSEKMLADFLTKPLSKVRFESLCSSIGLQ